MPAVSDQTGPTAGQTGQTGVPAAEPLDRSDRPWRRSDRHLLGFVQRGSLLVLSGISAQVHWRSDRPQRRSDRRQLVLGFRPSQLAVRPPATPVRPAPAVRPVLQRRSDRQSTGQSPTSFACPHHYKRGNTPHSKRGRIDEELELCSCLGLASKHP